MTTKYYAICPTCQERILLTERKDFESFTQREYVEHANAQHPDPERDPIFGPDHAETIAVTDTRSLIDAASWKASEARALWLEFQVTMRTLGSAVREIDLGEWHRVDAYPGWDVDRDQGCRMSMLEWIDEIIDSLEATERRLDRDEENDL